MSKRGKDQPASSQRRSGASRAGGDSPRRGHRPPGARRGTRRRRTERDDVGQRHGGARSVRGRAHPASADSEGRVAGRSRSRPVSCQALPRWLRQALEHSGIQPRHALGQHFLHDGQVLDRQLAYAELDGSQRVLEIGAGVGQLTQRLAAHSARLTAIEKDRRFAPLLEAVATASAGVRLVWGDALQVPLPAVDTVVANLPFGPALPLTFRLLEHRFQRAVLMYQRRLAGRLCARVGEPQYGRLSVAVGRIAQVELLEVVPPSAFYPQPQVESALVLVRRIRPRFDVPSEPFFRSLLEALFARREDSVGQVVDAWAQAADAVDATGGREARSRSRPVSSGWASLGSACGSGRSGPAEVRARLAKPGRGFPTTGVFSAAQARAVLSRLPGKMRRKPVFRLTPREFGVLSWALWRIDPQRAR